MKSIDSDKVMDVFLYVSLVVSILAVILGVYDAVVAETVEIRKDSFQCTKSHDESSLRYDVALNMSVPESTTVCDNYARIK